MQKVGCCPAGSLPALTVDYTPQGEVKDLENGLKIYQHGSGDNVVIIINDIFGFNGGRTKAIVDHLAHEGFYAILPDLFRGQSFDPNTPISVETVVPFILQFQWEQVWKDIKQVIDTVRAQGGNKRFALVGFCWGAWVNFNACGTGEFVCAANPHPALLLCPAYQQDVFELIKNIKCPQLLLPAGNDEQNLKEGGEIVKALESKSSKSRTKTYPDMLHGWVSRGDLTNPEILRDCTDALKEVVNFLRENFS